MKKPFLMLTNPKNRIAVLLSLLFTALAVIVALRLGDGGDIPAFADGGTGGGAKGIFELVRSMAG